MITQIEYERLQQEIDDLKWKLVSYEQIDKDQRRKIDQLKQILRDARAKERERCATICSHSTSMWECIGAIKALKDEE